MSLSDLDRCGLDGWCTQGPQAESSFTFHGVWGTGPDEVIVVGDGGTTLTWDGVRWQLEQLPTVGALSAIWGDDTGRIFAAAGGDGTILRRDAGRWQPTGFASGGPVLGICGLGPREACGSPGPRGLVFFDGSQWLSRDDEALLERCGAAKRSLAARLSKIPQDGFATWRGGPVGVPTDGRTWSSGPMLAVAVDSDATVQRFDGERWHMVFRGLRPTRDHFLALWGRSADDVYAAGVGGRILHFDGHRWTVEPTGTTETLHGLFGDGDAVFTVGRGGTILRRGSEGWQAMESGTTERLLSVWGSSSTDLFAVGTGGTVLHFDGHRWQRQRSGTSETLWSVHGSAPNEVLAVGRYGEIVRYDGRRWRRMESGTDERLYGVRATGRGEAVAVGERGTILALEGRSWRALERMTTAHLLSIWSSEGRLLVSGSDGTVLSRDARGLWQRQEQVTPNTLLAIWGTTESDGDAEIFAVALMGSVVHFPGPIPWPDAASAIAGIDPIWRRVPYVGDDMLPVEGYREILGEMVSQLEQQTDLELIRLTSQAEQDPDGFLNTRHCQVNQPCQRYPFALLTALERAQYVADYLVRERGVDPALLVIDATTHIESEEPPFIDLRLETFRRTPPPN
jgi:hypothetical protein